jgi:plastocyanin
MAGGKKMNTHYVKMKDFAFQPSSLTIAVGDAVIWQNDGAANHTATRTDAPAFNTGYIGAGHKSAAVTFNSAGTFAYYCIPHKAHMTGEIVVQ